MPEEPALSIVVPAYKRPWLYRGLVKDMSHVLGLLGIRWEMIIVDDGSGPPTTTVLTQLGTLDSRVKPIFLKRNFGQRTATFVGIRRAQGAYILVMDCDIRCPNRTLQRVLRLLSDGVDFVSVRRMNRWRTHPVRALYSHLLSYFVRACTGAGFQDPTSPVKGLRRSVRTYLANPACIDAYLAKMTRIRYAEIDGQVSCASPDRSSYSIRSLGRRLMEFTKTIVGRWNEEWVDERIYIGHVPLQP